LYKALVETKRAARVSGAAYQLHDPGILRIMAEVAPGNEPPDVLGTMTEIIESVAESGVTEEEVDRSRQHWLKQWELSLADSARIARDLSEWEAQGDWRLIFLYRDRLEEVTPDSVRNAARRYLQRNNRTVGVYLPTEAPERVSVPLTPNLTEMIGDYKGREALATGEAFDVAPANIESRTQRIMLDSGIKAALLPKKTRGESVQMVLTLRYGDLEGLAGRTTACEVLPQLMLRGTKDLTRQQIQDLQDRSRTQIVSFGELGQATFIIESRREFLPAALDLLRQVLREPSLPASELEILRTGQLSSLQKQLSDPQSLARATISRAINPYEPDDPRYAPSIQESMDRWQALQREDVAELHAQFVSGRNGELSLVGDFDAAEIRPLLEEMFADWQAPHGYTRIPRIGKMDLKETRQVIHTPDKENAVYFAATVFPMNDHDPEYVPLVIGNEIFGSGGLSSRLGDRVRQEEGLSYGIGSMVQARSQDDRAVFYIRGITNPANMGKVEAAVAEELAKLLKDGITEEELNAARTGYLEGQKVERSDDAQLAYLLTTTLEADRDMSYYADVETQALQLTPEVVNEALRKWIDPRRITRVVAGDFEKAQREAAAGPTSGR
jgi:zinc protease